MMKLRLTVFLTLICCLPFLTFSQESEPEPSRMWVKLGLNAGVAWQSSDVRARLGPGGGATLEFPLIYNRDQSFGVSIRGRYLHTTTFGQDLKRTSVTGANPAISGGYRPGLDYSNQGTYFANHRSRVNELAAELVLNLQPGFPGPGWYFSLFGGFGLEWYKVNIDQLGPFGSMYDYSQVETASNQAARDDLWFIRDYEYESDAHNSLSTKLTVAPALGVNVGYRFNPYLSLDWTYKMTLPFTDYLDGQAVVDRSLINGIDIYHYTSLGLGLWFGDPGKKKPRRPSNPISNYDIKTPPRITFLGPADGTSFSGDCRVTIRARLVNIIRKTQFRLIKNGRTIPMDAYSFDPNSGILEYITYLDRGTTEITISASNPSGRRNATLRVSCGQAPVVLPNPVVDRQMTICVPGRNGNRMTQVILESEWPYYRSIGAVPGPCPVIERQIEVCVFDPYAPGGSQSLLIPESEWPYYQSIGASLGACSPRMLTICTTDPDYPSERITLRISESAWPWYAQYGATRGPCPSSCTCLTICMVDPNAPGGVRTLTITQDEWPRYERMGAVPGPCSPRDMLICYQEPCSPHGPQTLRISESAWPYYRSRGARRGPCPESTMEICLPDQNASGGSRTLTIRESEWPRYQAMGASWGACSSRYITICLPLPNGDRVTMCISETVWPYYRQRGAIRGVCPPANITICMPDPSAPNGSRTMSISETEWPWYQSQGAVRGPCGGSNTTICWPSPATGQPTQLIVSSTVLPWYQGQGATIGPCPSQQIVICLPDPNAPGGSRTICIPENQWLQYQSQGAVRGPCGGENITICWQPNGNNPQTLSIPASLWPWYQSQGANTGACEPPMVTLCLPDPDAPSGSQQVTVPRDQMQYYLSQGAVQGPCSGNLIEICWKRSGSLAANLEIQIPANLWPWYQAQGASRGKCPEEKIQICLPRPGATNGGITLEINRSEWPKYQSQGAVMGSCQGSMTICMPSGNPPTWNTTTIFANLWPHFQAQGAVEGKCPEPEIVICVPDLSAPNGSRTITIKESEWPQYQSRGATEGPCETNTMRICLPAGIRGRNSESLLISTSVWPHYQSLGATQGECPEPKIKICVPDPSSLTGGRTLMILESEWEQYQANGAVKGDCGQTIQICFASNPNQLAQTITIPVNLWPHYQSLGGQRGPCPTQVMDSVKICFPDPTNKNGGRTMMIARRDLPSYQDRGAVEGECGQVIQVCMPEGVIGRLAGTILIPTNLLPYYQGLGAQEGPCPEPTITICLPDPNANGGSRQLTINQSEWPQYQAQGAIQGPCLSATSTLCYNNQTIQVSQTVAQWYLSHGATAGECQTQSTWDRSSVMVTGSCDGPVAVFTVTNTGDPGNGDMDGPVEYRFYEDNVLVQTGQLQLQGGQSQGYNRLSNGKNIRMEVDQRPGHPGNSRPRADVSCTMPENQNPERRITICNVPPSNPASPQTLTIPESEWQQYSGTATRGACDMAQVSICYQNRSITIPKASLAYFKGQGAQEGPCAEKKITICNVPPSNPANPQTLTINESEWLQYATTATKGACDMAQISICYQNRTLRIPRASLSYYKGQGAQEGPCAEKQITICNVPPRNPASPQTLTIKESEWPNYASTSTKGACDMAQVNICYQDRDMTIPRASLAYFKGQGAREGRCPERQITICNVPPSNPGNPQTLTINESEWSNFSRTATKGACDMAQISICYQNRTLRIPRASLSYYKGQGAQEGPCAEKQITICNVPPRNPASPQTLTIKESEWSNYANTSTKGACDMAQVNICYQDRNMTIPRASLAYFKGQGAREGRCPERQITICNVPPSNPGNPQTLTINESEWSNFSRTATKGACDMAQVSICYQNRTLRIPRASLNYYKGQGAKDGPCPEKKITICNVPPRNPASPQTLTIKESEWPNYANTSTKGSCDMAQVSICYQDRNMTIPRASLAYFKGQGAREGRCPERQITICNVPPSNPASPQTLTIKESDWSRYSRTATKGSCDMARVSICYQGRNMTIPRASLAYFKSQGAQDGNCPEKKITICNVPPSNPASPQTLTINESEWSRYSRTATKGSCDMARVTICYQNRTLTIPRASLAYFKSQGAQDGKCPEKKITICNVPPSNPASPQTLTIKESEWSRYSRTASKGACDMARVTICYQNRTLTIPRASLAYYKSQGAKDGKCPEPRQLKNDEKGDDKSPDKLKGGESEKKGSESELRSRDGG